MSVNIFCDPSGGSAHNSVRNDAGGDSGLVCGNCSAVLGGIPSFTSSNYNCGDGSTNCVDANTFVAVCYGVIGGGQNNKVCAGTHHSSIFSGFSNTVSGSCSSILGGSGNSDGGFNNVFIAGSGITAVAAGATYINGLYASAIPFIAGGVGALPGQVYWDVPPPPDVNAKALYIK